MESIFAQAPQATPCLPINLIPNLLADRKQTVLTRLPAVAEASDVGDSVLVDDDLLRHEEVTRGQKDLVLGAQPVSRFAL